MVSDARAAVVREMTAAIDRHDLDALAAHPGLSELVQHIPTLLGAFPDLEHTVEEQTMAGEVVATRAVMRGTHRGPFMGVAPTGRRIESMVLMLDTVVESKIVLHYALPDWLSVLVPIGAIPAFGPHPTMAAVGSATPAGSGEAMDAVMQRVSLGGVEIEYSKRGAGDPLVLIHGGVLGDWFVPLSASPTLDGFCVINVRRPGYGAIPPGRHLTIGDHASLVAELMDRLDLHKIHCVGHSSSCLIGLQLAIDRPDLVHSLILLEPAPAGGMQAPASANLAREFIGPAMGAFAAGDVGRAFDLFLRGVGGDDYRAVIEKRLGGPGYERAVHASPFFFRDEIHAVQEWQFGPDDAARIRQPVLIVEGGESARLGPMSRQITELALGLLPHAEAATIADVNHLMPLQDPDAIGGVVAAFARRHPMSPVGTGASGGSRPE